MSTEPIDARDIWRGLRVVWLHVPRGGYGYVLRVPATVVSASRTHVTIDAERADRSVVRRVVNIKSIRPMSRYATLAEKAGKP